MLIFVCELVFFLFLLVFFFIASSRYLLCSAAAAGQYRFPVVDVWRCLIVQLVG